MCDFRRECLTRRETRIADGSRLDGEKGGTPALAFPGKEIGAGALAGGVILPELEDDLGVFLDKTISAVISVMLDQPTRNLRESLPPLIVSMLPLGARSRFGHGFRARFRFVLACISPFIASFLKSREPTTIGSINPSRLAAVLVANLRRPLDELWDRFAVRSVREDIVRIRVRSGVTLGAGFVARAGELWEVSRSIAEELIGSGLAEKVGANPRAATHNAPPSRMSSTWGERTHEMRKSLFPERDKRLAVSAEPPPPRKLASESDRWPDPTDDLLAELRRGVEAGIASIQQNAKFRSLLEFRDDESGGTKASRTRTAYPRTQRKAVEISDLGILLSAVQKSHPEETNTRRVLELADQRIERIQAPGDRNIVYAAVHRSIPPGWIKRVGKQRILAGYWDAAEKLLREDRERFRHSISVFVYKKKSK